MMNHPPTIQLEDDNLIARFDYEGLMIVRKNAKEGEPEAFNLTPQEASSFAAMYSMATTAVGMHAITNPHIHINYGDAEPEEEL